MNVNTVAKKLKAILSEKKLNRLGKQVGFTKRKRNVDSFQMVISLIAALGDKKTRYLSEILRYYNQLTEQNIKYKPFHNQLAKPELLVLMREVADRVFNHWVNDVLDYTKGSLSQFNKILIQDGSSIMVNRSLKNIYPGRFSNTCPAAIELHVTLDLKKGCFEKTSITPDSFSERNELPTLDSLKGQLLLADRGYYSAKFIKELDSFGGYFVLRAKGLKTILVSSALLLSDKNLIGKKPMKLCDVIKKLPKKGLVDMDVEISGHPSRLIGYWSKTEKQYILLVTNLSREKFKANEIGKLYRLRWQVELLFKECKSYNSLRGFQTSKGSLQESLIWASLIATTLKRFITGSIERMFVIEMSTMIVSKTTSLWWLEVLKAIVMKLRKGLFNALNNAFEFLSKNATRAHPKRDRITGVLQYGLEPILR